MPGNFGLISKRVGKFFTDLPDYITYYLLYITKFVNPNFEIHFYWLPSCFGSTSIRFKVSYYEHVLHSIL